MNIAEGALPGQRFTDPDGGTWVRRADDAVYPWHEIDATGELRWRSQEEAEAAGLVAVVAETELQTARDIIEQRDRELDTWAEWRALQSPAAPAPLDPGNPEDWRKHAVMSRHLADRCMGTTNDDVLEAAANLADRMADRLDRERAEAEQDAADRKRAEEIAALDTESLDSRAYSREVGLVLAGIRAERERLAKAAEGVGDRGDN